MSTGSLVGRTDELAAIASVLKRERCLVLQGLGGVGKSRLAREVATRERARERRVSWVDASLATDETTLRAEISRALRLSNSAGEGFAREIAARCDLLIVDRCEDIASAAADVMHHLRECADDLSILATSRIAADGLPSLTLEPLGSDAVQLFIDRALASNPHFVADAATLETVARICSLLGGIPLAIEIAASYVPYIDVVELAARVDAGKLHDVVGPLEAILAWSFERLDEQARTLLRRSSIYEGAFRYADADAAAAIVDVKGSLERLTAASLLSSSTSGAGFMEFRLPDPVREFARARLDDAAETGATIDRVTAALADSAERLAARIAAGDTTAHLRLSSSFAPIASVLRVAEPSDTRRLVDACRIAGSLGSHLARAGYQLEMRDSIATLIAQCEHHGADLGEPYDRLLEAAAFVANRVGELETAIALNEKRVERARNSRDSNALAHALSTSLVALLHSNRLEQANEIVAELPSLARSVKDPGLLARVYRALGQVAFAQMRFDEARPHYEAFLALGPSAVPRATYAIVLHDYGAVLAYAGEIEAAHSYFDACIEATIETDPSTAAHALGSKAYWNIEEDKCERAHRDLQRAIALFPRGINFMTQFYITELYVAASLRDEQAEDLCFVLGFVEAGRNRLGFVGQGTDSARYERLKSVIESRIPAAVRKRASAAGRLATWEQVLARLEKLRPGDTSVEHFERFASLSAREREIAELVGRGRTNREIADELVVSVRTVDHHVASIFRKLGIQKREELER